MNVFLLIERFNVFSYHPLYLYLCILCIDTCCLHGRYKWQLLMGRKTAGFVHSDDVINQWVWLNILSIKVHTLAGNIYDYCSLPIHGTHYYEYIRLTFALLKMRCIYFYCYELQ